MNWFNHSCRPTVTTTKSDPGQCSDAKIVAMTDLKKDEEVFCSYIGWEGLIQTKSERRKVLHGWLGEDCQCLRCMRKN
jgi:hypothetical protein